MERLKGDDVSCTVVDFWPLSLCLSLSGGWVAGLGDAWRFGQRLREKEREKESLTV